MAGERVLVPLNSPKSLGETSPSLPEAEEADLSIETVRVRAETVTLVLRDILRGESMADGRNP
jgi:hypothetical protein